tara:strand:- start:953 stop:1228 length:276 start_codon:yes stop_codon:yes gene_type:complete
MANYATDGKVGIERTGADSSPKHRLGTTVAAADNTTLIYVYANEVIASGTGVELAAAFTASASSGGELTALYAIASGEYGWVSKSTITVQS